jgi:hypothetical protein
MISFPDYILYEGRKVYACEKNKTFAIYMLPAAYMNKNIYLSRDQWERHLKKTGY